MEPMKLAVDMPQFLDDMLGRCRFTTFSQLHASLDRTASQLGFDGFVFAGLYNADGYNRHRIMESNFDESWCQRYKERQYMRLDPTVIHSLSSSQPLVWSDEMYVTDPQREFQREASSYGLTAGVTFPIHSKEGDKSMLSLTLKSSGPAATAHISDMLLLGPLAAKLAHQGVRDIIRKRAPDIAKSDHAASGPKLTKREVEVLQWIAVGKNTWEISQLTRLSEHGVIFHVRNLMRKFDVSSRYQAVVKAIAAGLLSI